MQHEKFDYSFIPPEILLENDTAATVRTVGAQFLPLGAKNAIKRILFEYERRRYPEYKIQSSDVTAKFYMRTKQDAWIRRMGLEGSFTHAIIQTMKEVGQTQGTIWDVGAAQGIYTTFGAKVGGNVIAFEPDALSRNDLGANLQLNNCSDLVTVFPYAIGDTDGTVTLYTDGPKQSMPSIRHTTGQKGKVEVPLRSIDSLISEGLAPPNLLKIDIEGAEALALRGGRGLFLSDHKPPHVFVEMHPSFLQDYFGTTQQDVWNCMTEEYGYRPQLAISRGQELMCYFTSQ